jgi:hypothetical protein
LDEFPFLVSQRSLAVNSFLECKADRSAYIFLYSTPSVPLISVFAPELHCEVLMSLSQSGEIDGVEQGFDAVLSLLVDVEHALLGAI